MAVVAEGDCQLLILHYDFDVEYVLLIRMSTPMGYMGYTLAKVLCLIHT